MLKPGLTRAPRAEAQVTDPHKHSKPCKGATRVPIPRQNLQTEYRRFCDNNGKPLHGRYAWDSMGVYWRGLCPALAGRWSLFGP